MKTTVFVLFILILSNPAFGQNKLKTREELVKQVSAANVICGVQRTTARAVIFPNINDSDYLNTVTCQTGNNSPVIMTVSFSYNGEDMTKSIDDFKLSFRAMTRNKDWYIPAHLIDKNARPPFSWKEVAELKNSETYKQEWRFREDSNLTFLTDTQAVVIEKPQNYHRGIAVSFGQYLGQISLREEIYFNADRAKLLTLTNSANIKIKLGNFDKVPVEKVPVLFQTILDLAIVK